MASISSISYLLPSFSDLPDTLKYVIFALGALFVLFILWIICKIKDCFVCIYSIFKCLFCCCNKGYDRIEE